MDMTLPDAFYLPGYPDPFSALTVYCTRELQVKESVENGCGGPPELGCACPSRMGTARALKGRTEKNDSSASGSNYRVGLVPTAAPALVIAIYGSHVIFE